eukprot:6208272-Pleurochrysis_carterae.AAC.3
MMRLLHRQAHDEGLLGGLCSGAGVAQAKFAEVDRVQLPHVFSRAHSRESWLRPQQAPPGLLARLLRPHSKVGEPGLPCLLQRRRTVWAFIALLSTRGGVEAIGICVRRRYLQSCVLWCCGPKELPLFGTVQLLRAGPVASKYADRAQYALASCLRSAFPVVPLKMSLQSAARRPHHYDLRIDSYLV